MNTADSLRGQAVECLHGTVKIWLPLLQGTYSMYHTLKLKSSAGRRHLPACSHSTNVAECYVLNEKRLHRILHVSENNMLKIIYFLKEISVLSGCEDLFCQIVKVISEACW